MNDHKPIKVFCLVNTLQSVSSFVYSNHIHFFVWTAKNMPWVEFIFFTPHRMTIDNARNQAAKAAMYYECDYLLFLDDDVLVPPDALSHLIAADKDIVAGLVIIRGMPFNIMAFEFQGEGQNKGLVNFNKLPLDGSCKEGHIRYEAECDPCQDVSITQLAKCDAVGFSLALIKIDVIQALDPPYFITGPLNTEDVYFCMKCRNLEPIPEIYLHTGVRCGHLLNPEPIEFGTRRKFFEFYKEEYEHSLKTPRRDIDHINRCLTKLGNPKFTYVPPLVEDLVK